MKRRPQRWRRPLALLAMTTLPACSRGCAESAAPTAEPGAVGAAAQPGSPTAKGAPGAAAASDADAAERALTITLPDRRRDLVLPAFDTLPRRRLPRFDAGQSLIVRLDAAGLRALDEVLLQPAQASDEAIGGLLRRAGADYAVRAGVAANRLTLALDRGCDRTQAARLRRLAHGAGRWRVVALAREEGSLYEVLLDPPGPRPGAAEQQHP